MATRSTLASLLALVLPLSLSTGCGLWSPSTPTPPANPQSDLVVSSAKDLTDAVQKFNSAEQTDNSCNGFQLSEDTIRQAIDNNWSAIPSDFQPIFRDIHDGNFDSTTTSLAGFSHCYYLRIIVKKTTADSHGNLLSYSLTIATDGSR